MVVNNLATQKKILNQLRLEANIDRQKVSKVCKDIIKYCQENEASDMLVHGWTNMKENPFKESSHCCAI
ncbi:hypothetical protein ACOME3_004936 [Neoechinorhynchus agilis]